MLSTIFICKIEKKIYLEPFFNIDDQTYAIYRKSKGIYIVSV